MKLKQTHASAHLVQLLMTGFDCWQISRSLALLIVWSQPVWSQDRPCTMWRKEGC